MVLLFRNSRPGHFVARGPGREEPLHHFGEDTHLGHVSHGYTEAAQMNPTNPKAHHGYDRMFEGIRPTATTEAGPKQLN